MIKRNLVVIGYSNGFTLWAYNHDSDSKSLLAEGFFDEAADMLRKGDHIHITGKVQGIVFVSSIEEFRDETKPFAPLLGTSVGVKPMAKLHELG